MANYIQFMHSGKSCSNNSQTSCQAKRQTNCMEQRPSRETNNCSVGFEVFTAVVMKSMIFWDMTPRSLLSFNRHFGGSVLTVFLLNLFLRLWGWRQYVPPKRQLKLNGLHGVISRKMILLIIAQPLQNILAFYETWMFITMFTSSNHYPPSRTKWIQSIPCQPICLRLIFILLHTYA
jgi:hypothetical protein